MLINAAWQGGNQRSHVYVSMYIYMQVLNMHGTHVFVHSLIHLINVLEILLYPKLEIYKYFILPEKDGEIGTKDIS